MRSWTSNAAGDASAYFIHTESITVNIACQIDTWVPNAELRLVVSF